MLHLASYDIVFQEIPGEVTLALNLSGCPNLCEGCHSPHLRDDIGEVLDEAMLAGLLEAYGSAVTCVCFMGGDAEPVEVERLALLVRSYGNSIKAGKFEVEMVGVEGIEIMPPEVERCVVDGFVAVECEVVVVDEFVVGECESEVADAGRLKAAWYSGKGVFPTCCSLRSFDYVKLGPYIPARGGLRSKNTNQNMYKIAHGEMEDITYLFSR